MIPRVILNELRAVARVAAQEAAGVANLAQYLGYLGIQRAAMRAQAVVNSAKPIADDIAWLALTGSIRVSRSAVSAVERAAQRFASSTEPTREALALRLDRLADVVGAPEKPGALFKGVGFGARFLFPLELGENLFQF